MTDSAAAARTVSLDLRGQVCPATLLRSLRSINDLKDDLRRGAVRLVIRTDHREATATVPDAATSMGYAVRVEPEGDAYVITVEGGA